ncbi:late sexual development protein [Stipitochalara longipes BDJ]|nr:late sexual development protein [Stipitochalara longipes BDJ]
MHSLTLLLASAGLAAAAPFTYPLANGFPNLNTTALEQVYKLAGGTLPNGALPSTLTPNGVQALQLIAANELFEVAYFTELLQNITSKVHGYHEGHHQYIIDTLTSVIAQEQVHVLSANGVLANANQTTIQPCQYDFPVSDFHSAIALAQTFTDVVLGVLPVAQSLFAADGGDEAALVPIVGSIIGQEGEQNGYYRFLQKKVASAAPLLTGGAPQFAYTAISQFIVPGSCPNIKVIGLTAFPALTLESTPKAANSTQMFSVSGAVSAANATLVYISGQNLPFSVPISNVSVTGGKTTFAACFPYDNGFNRGLTIGALVAGAGKTFNSTAEVAAATLFGPALIELD